MAARMFTGNPVSQDSIERGSPIAGQAGLARSLAAPVGWMLARRPSCDQAVSSGGSLRARSSAGLYCTDVDRVAWLPAGNLA
jgi:hypothetical protein